MSQGVRGALLSFGDLAGEGEKRASEENRVL